MKYSTGLWAIDQRLCMSKVSKEAQKKGLYAMYVEGFERCSRYTVKAVMLCMLKVSKETQIH